MCRLTSPADASDAVSPDSNDGFITAPHAPFPLVPNAGGPIIANPEVVTVTFANDTNRAQEEAFGHWIVGSSWLRAVGADYGVGAGIVVADAELSEDAPATMTSAQLETLLEQGLADGSIPPTAHPDQAVYMVYFPARTVFTEAQYLGGYTSCMGNIGYHNYVTPSVGAPFVYTASFNCTSLEGQQLSGFGLTALQAEEWSASHEIIEAATDPQWSTAPAYQVDASDWAWSVLGDEVADLCAYPPVTITDDGFVAQRIWSNTLAQAGNDPCAPLDLSHPYYTVQVMTNSPQGVISINAGQTITVTLEGWSTAPVEDWSVTVLQSSDQNGLTGTLSAPTINNGQSLTLTLTLSRTMTSTGDTTLMLQSSHSAHDFHVQPVVVTFNGGNRAA